MLAAGGSRRMGFPKATTPIAGASPLERLALVLSGRSVTVVTSEPQVDACAAIFPEAQILVNARPERGMTSSLLVADEALARHFTLGVVLADKPFVTRGTLDACETIVAGGGPEVVVASARDERGHPVYFGPQARVRLADLPEGDTLRLLRDDPGLHCAVVATDDDGVLTDLDTRDAWFEAERRLVAAADAQRRARSHA